MHNKTNTFNVIFYSPLVGNILWLGTYYYKLDPSYDLLEELFPKYQERHSFLYLDFKFIHYLSGYLIETEPCSTFKPFFVSFLWHQEV